MERVVTTKNVRKSMAVASLISRSLISDVFAHSSYRQSSGQCVTLQVGFTQQSGMWSVADIEGNCHLVSEVVGRTTGHASILSLVESICATASSDTHVPSPVVENPNIRL